ncbi:MAG TPA: hypothetical protein VEB43_12180 [Anaeromyxobacter sp.]|nr:hypothetical protein [Anaeromyxobacter sp.]
MEPYRIEDLPGYIVHHAQSLIDVAERQQRAVHLGKLSTEIARHYRAIGICALLIEADVEGFYGWLLHSAVARRHYLRRCARDGVTGDRWQRTSNAGPFLDAVAAGAWDVARQVAALSPGDWIQGAEYEDDFCHARFLHLLAEPGADPAELARVLDRYERALEGGEDLRLDVDRALLSKDGDAFGAAFRTLLADRERKLRELADPKRDSVQAQDYCFEPDRQVFVEGLALLRLAEGQGIATEPEYPTCPGLARRAPLQRFQPIAWPKLRLDSDL